MPKAPREIAVDDRGRCSLAKVRRRQFARYLAAEDEDGTITLTPVVVLTPAEVGKLREDRGWLPPDARVLRLPGEAPREPSAAGRTARVGRAGTSSWRPPREPPASERGQP